MMERLDVMRLKIAALLHDPPDKPWKLEGHEERAIEAIRKLAGFEGVPGVVREADRLASSVDRYVLSMLMGDRYIRGFLMVKEVKLKNVVNPAFEVALQQLGDVEGYWRDLEKLANVGDVGMRYLLLYALYELLWVDRFPAGPADTRVPTHTVFDHNYATATALNWVSEGGLLVGIDLGGVQEFIRASRKLRDMWVSSYLVSALVWYTILPLVREIGPDVAITPSLRYNPIFHHWLRDRWDKYKSQLSQAVTKDIEELLERVEKYVYLSDELRKMYEELGYLSDERREMFRALKLPPYAAFPERATLALPPQSHMAEILGGKELRKFLEERFKEGWKKLWDAARKLANSRAGAKGDLLWRFVDRVFEVYKGEFKEAGFHEVPPLTLRVEVVEVDKASDGTIYDVKYQELLERMARRKYVRVEQSALLNLSKLTESAFGRGVGYPEKSRRGFDYCTSCGIMPALVILPAREGDTYETDEYGRSILRAAGEAKDEEELKERYKELKNKVALAHMKAVFTPGEKLCPWCFLKRVVSLEPRLLNVLLLDVDVDEFVRKLEKGPNVRFPSTSDVASIRLREKLVEKCGEVAKRLAGFTDVTKPLLKASGEASALWPAERRLVERLGECRDVDEMDRAVLKGVVLADAEELWFSADGWRQWVRLIDELGLSKYLWRYFALLVADGDSIGDLINGSPKALWPKYENVENLLKEVVVKSAEGDLKKLIDAIVRYVSGELHERHSLDIWAEEIAGRYKMPREEVEKRVDDVVNKIGEILKEGRIPLTFAYHSTISAALSRQALVDAAFITSLGGFVVYAGGDDLLAFLPVDASLRAVYTTRRAFAGAEIDTSHGNKVEFEFRKDSYGFVKIGKALLPTLPGVGRSYCIFVGHYAYPLQLAIGTAREMLEVAKEASVTCCSGLPPLYKDSLVVA
ncbi:MAG: type III-B CRISPR-associated protein Cas10/Cmr2, partial [Pyrobaculum sp.]